MISPPPDVSESPRRHSTRHRSRQRDRILSWLQAADSHPTAAEIHEALLPELSALSLGTVYRNLEVLVADGDVEEVPSAVGAKRYDGNVEPHHHFNCERCGRILDVDIPVPSGLTRRLARESGLRANRVQISFTGLCAACTEAPECHEESLNNQNQEEGKTWVT